MTPNEEKLKNEIETAFGKESFCAEIYNDLLKETETLRKNLSESNVVSSISCIDCGGTEEKSKAHYGHNSYNNKKYSDSEYGYVCQRCWDGRGLAVMR